MKKFIALFFILPVVFTGCKDKEEKPEVCGTGMPYTELLLGSSTNYLLGLWDDPYASSVGGTEPRLFVIRSQADLVKYRIEEVDRLPEIDFSKYTLLLVDGYANSGVSSVEKHWFHDSANYRLHISVILNLATVMSVWRTGILVEPIPESARVKLEVTTGP